MPTSLATAGFPPLSRQRATVLTLLAMTAFAGNSLLCRQALKHTTIDPATFTTLRLISGAMVLWLIVRWRGGAPSSRGRWRSALALFVYAAAFSFAYVSLSAATGALLLFGAVQATMIGAGLARGERLSIRQLAGLVAALGGLAGLLLPGLSAPPLAGALLMLLAGVAWGAYSLLGKGVSDPTLVTAGNFLRSVPLAISLSLLLMPVATWDARGAMYALLSGALASGVGYSIWYAALRGLSSTTAATVQLTVPVIAAAGGVALLSEPVTLRLLLASIAILGGVWLVITGKQPTVR